MVSMKNVTFKVDKQTLSTGPPPQAVGSIINCRKPRGKSAPTQTGEVKSQQVPLRVAGIQTPAPPTSHNGLKRKRISDVQDQDGTSTEPLPPPAKKAHSDRPFPRQKPKVPKPTKLRKGRHLQADMNADCWFIILGFTNPAQLLEMYDTIPLSFRFLSQHETLWKYSRDNYYSNALPDPPKGLKEFQYAHLLYGNGCMSCAAREKTRKTFWPFLRRWCKDCLKSKAIKEHDAKDIIDTSGDEDLKTKWGSLLPSAIFDSWNNFTGVGPASKPGYKTVYIRSDVEKLVADFSQEAKDNPATWHAEKHTWMANKQKQTESVSEFAKAMGTWEEKERTQKTQEYRAKKEARKQYYAEQASKLNPPISIADMENTDAYKRAIRIPKGPNSTSWLSLKPKLEDEVRQKQQLDTEQELSRSNLRVLRVQELISPGSMASSIGQMQSPTQATPSTSTGTLTPAPGGLNPTTLLSPMASDAQESYLEETLEIQQTFSEEDNSEDSDMEESSEPEFTSEQSPPQEVNNAGHVPPPNMMAIESLLR